MDSGGVAGGTPKKDIFANIFFFTKHNFGVFPYFVISNRSSLRHGAQL